MVSCGAADVPSAPVKVPVSVPVEAVQLEAQAWAVPAMPVTRAGGRLHLEDLHLFPEDDLMWTAFQHVLTDWEDCTNRHPDGCGYLVAEVDRRLHSLKFHTRMYVHTIEGPLGQCLADNMHGLHAGKKLPPELGYVVAVGVAPSAEELPGCIDGIAAPTESYLRSRRQKP